MGISGLLQFIKDASVPINIVKYKGSVVAVDTYCWLHKGAFSCAEKLAKGESTDQWEPSSNSSPTAGQHLTLLTLVLCVSIGRYVWYCMKFVDMLLAFNIKPILVFDGRNLPSKEEVEKSRREWVDTAGFSIICSSCLKCGSISMEEDQCHKKRTESGLFLNFLFKNPFFFLLFLKKSINMK